MVDRTDLLTKAHLDVGLAEFQSHIDRDLAALVSTIDRRLRIQTWITSCLTMAGVLLAFTAGRLA